MKKIIRNLFMWAYRDELVSIAKNIRNIEKIDSGENNRCVMDNQRKHGAIETLEKLDLLS